MRITRNQFLRFAVVAIGTGGTAVVACDAGTAATPGRDNPGGPLPGEDAGEGGHRGPQKPDSSTEEDAGGDATTDATGDANDGGDGGGVDAGEDAGEDAPVAVRSCEQNGASTVIGTNHGHGLTISAAAFANVAGQQTFQLMFAHAGAFHAITLTDVEMNDLVAGQTLVFTSTAAGFDNHTHTVTVSCA